MQYPRNEAEVSGAQTNKKPPQDEPRRGQATNLTEEETQSHPASRLNRGGDTSRWTGKPD